ncbi:polysaccharide pyruvyl transferase CsaB [Halobacillus seohaensis]|uniref:Polysaccharide pyruvyl transferase CsaB n=1 Tax=Halobacillus seohaensis TaxID=447421 RepID=A0ABW2EL18_9BACI
MKVILSGYYGFHNTGDEAILYSLIQQLRAHDASIDITVLSNDVTHTRNTYQVQAVNRWNVKEVIQAIKQSDGLITGGGSLLQDVTGIKSIIYYTGVMRIAKFLRRPVFVYSQGMGPITGRIAKKLTKVTLNKVDYLTVRDEESKQLLTEIGVKKEITVVPDSVMGLDYSPTTSSYTQNNNSIIMVSVRDWPSQQPYKEKIAHALDRLVRPGGYQIVFIPMHGENDAQCSEDIRSLMEESAEVLPHHLSIQEKIDTIANSKLLIGMRLHSLIFSAISTTPFIAISYDPKIDAFANLLDQNVLVHVNDEFWQEEEIIQEVSRLNKERTHVQNHLKGIIWKKKSESNQAVKEIISMIENL